MIRGVTRRRPGRCNPRNHGSPPGSTGLASSKHFGPSKRSLHSLRSQRRSLSCLPLRRSSPEETKRYHFWLGVEGWIVMAPGVGRLVRGTHLVDAPGALPDPIAGLVVVFLHDVVDAYPQPTSLVSWLLLQSHRKLVAEFSEGMFKHSNWIGACPLKPLDCFQILTDFQGS